MDGIWYIATPNRNTVYWTTHEQFENYTAFVDALNEQFGENELFSTKNVIFSTKEASQIVSHNDQAVTHFICSKKS